MSERLKSIRAEFEEYGEVGLGSTMWLLDTCTALASELEAVKAERDALAKRINHDGTPVDIAALCVEIDEVTDELARVKAESLRVVKVGGPVLKNQTDGNDPLILGPDNELYNQRLSGEIYLMKMSGHPAWAELEDDTIVQPVRLERWEDEG